MAHVTDMLYQMLSTDGHGGGTTSFVGAANNFKILAPPNTELVLVRLNVYLEDSGQFRGDRYGGTTALTNGILCRIYDTDGTTVLKNFTPLPIKQIGHWGWLSGVDVFGTDYTTGTNTWIVRWTLAKSGSEASLKPGQSFVLTTQDNMAGGGADLTQHTAQMQGYKKTLAG